VEILADPGTYCYHGEPEWRRYFRSTLAHNTVEVAGRDQSTSGGPFLWTRHAETRLTELETESDGRVTAWSAEHDGYHSLDPRLHHVRSVRLSSTGRRVDIVDRLETSGHHPFRVAFHLGPDVEARLEGNTLGLRWPAEGSTRTATMALSPRATWSLARGSSNPTLGWYSPHFGEKHPTWSLIGEGSCRGSDAETLSTVLQFDCEPGVVGYLHPGDPL
jgi:hypothetical protein